MPNRSYTAGSQFRYGFNGKENDNDVKGTGNQQDYGMRIYDPRIGKFLSVDPLTADYPSWSPYPFAMNRPIDGIDLDGCEWQPVNATGENVAVGSKETSDYRWVGFGLDGKGAEGTVASAILRHGTSTYKFNSSFDQKTRRGTGSLAISDGKGNSLNIRIFGDNSAQWSQSSNGKITETAVYQDRFYKGTPGNISDKGTFVARDVTGYTGLDFSFKRTTNNVWCGWYPEAIESNGLGPVEFLIGAGEFRLAGRGLSALGRGLSYFGRNAAKGGGRAFWSGAGSEAKALAQGFQTLGQTRAGKNLARLTADMPYYPGSQAYYMWARLSKKYAQGAKGTVHVFQNAEHGVGMESIWRLYEYPALLKNPNVTDIIFHY